MPLEIEAAIIAYLKSYFGLTALVDSRIFVDGAVPEDTAFPYVSMFLVHGQDEKCFIESPNFAEDTFQFTSAALTKLETINVSRQIRLAFKDYFGIMGGAGGVVVQAILQDNRHDAKEKREDGAAIFYRDEDFIFQY